MTKGTPAGRLATRRARIRTVLVLATIFAAASGLLATPALAVAPFDGTTVSPGLGPTYGEIGVSLRPPGLEHREPAGAAAGADPQRGDRLHARPSSGRGQGSRASRTGCPTRPSGGPCAAATIYGVVVNALETPEQQRDYARWQQLRSLHAQGPGRAQALLASWGRHVKLPILVEANIHGGRGGRHRRDDAGDPRSRDAAARDERQSTSCSTMRSSSSSRQSTRRSGRRVAGEREPLRPEPRPPRPVPAGDPRQHGLQLEWLAPVGLTMHGYYNPTLVDGLTKPHNPGLEYDLFLYWNQRRLDANQAASTRSAAHPAPRQRLGRPRRQREQAVGPAVAEGWDDWGPFYSQTYGASSAPTARRSRCATTARLRRPLRLQARAVPRLLLVGPVLAREPHDHPADQLEIFRRGVTGAERRNCCDDPLVARPRLHRGSTTGWSSTPRRS